MRYSDVHSALLVTEKNQKKPKYLSEWIKNYDTYTQWNALLLFKRMKQISVLSQKDFYNLFISEKGSFITKSMVGSPSFLNKTNKT